MSIDVTAQQSKSLTSRVAAQIRAVMAYNQIRQSHLARQMGVSEQWLSVRLRGVQPIDLNDLDRIAAALGVEPVALIPTGGNLTTRGYHGGSVTRPSDRRPASQSGTRRPPPGPGRTSRVQRPVTA